MTLLSQHQDDIKLLADALLEHETLYGDDVKLLMTSQSLETLRAKKLMNDAGCHGERAQSGRSAQAQSGGSLAENDGQAARVDGSLAQGDATDMKAD